MRNRNISSLMHLEKIFNSFCVDLFSALDEIAASQDSDFKSIHQHLSCIIKNLLDTENNVDSQDACDIIYAMAAIGDEVFLGFEWPGKQYWEDNTLEQKFFGTLEAGEKIFSAITETLNTKEVLSTIKAELYLKILAIGFKGKYRDTDDENNSITYYKNSLFDFIERHDKSIFLIAYRMFQKEYTYTLPTITRKLLPDASVVNYFFALFLFCFLIVGSIVWVIETKAINQLIAEISNMAVMG